MNGLPIQRCPSPSGTTESFDRLAVDAVARAVLFDLAAEANVVVLDGAVGEPPKIVPGRSEDPALLVTLDHRAPQQGESDSWGSTPLEVPIDVLTLYPGPLGVGDALRVIGKASGEGKVFVTALAPARDRVGEAHGPRDRTS